MGVSRVYFWPSPRPDMMAELSEHLGSLDAVSVGQSLLFCRVYRHVTAAASKPLLCVWSSADPAHVVTVLGGKVAVHANRDLDLLLTRFKATYPLQNTIRIDSSEFTIGDLVVRYGTGSLLTALSTQSRGLLMELEYRPCASEADGAAILTAFEQQVIPVKMREQLKVTPDEPKGQPAIADDSPADVRTALKYIASFTQHELL